MKKLFTTLLTLSILFTYGQVPQGFSYQAVAFNSAGSPVVSSTVSVRISILDNSASGTTLYTETHSKTTNTSGLYSLTIGQGTPTLGTFASINWAVNSKFVKVELDPTGGTTYTTVGTSQFLSVPYALIADSVIKLPLSTSSFNFFVDKNDKQCQYWTCDSLAQDNNSYVNGGFLYQLIDGIPENVFVDWTVPSGITVYKCFDPYSVKANNDTIFKGVYDKNCNNYSIGNYIYHFAADTNISITNGNFTAQIVFRTASKTIKTFTRNFNVKNCPVKTYTNIVSSKTMITNTCSEPTHILTVTKNTKILGYKLNNLFGTGSDININSMCNGNFSFYFQSGGNSYSSLNSDVYIKPTGNIKIKYYKNSSLCEVEYQ